MGFPGGSDGKGSVYNTRPGFNPWVRKIPELGRSLREGNGHPHKHFCLENSMARGTQFMGLQRVGHNWRHTHVLFSTVAVGSCLPTKRARGNPFLHNLANIYCLWMFLMMVNCFWGTGKQSKCPLTEGQGSLACCSPWCHEESDMTWQLNNKLFFTSSQLRWVWFHFTDLKKNGV